MRYGDTSKRREAAKAPALAPAITRFEKWRIYNSSEGRVIFCGRHIDEREIERGLFYPERDAKREMREDGFADYAENCDECEVRTFGGIERATHCDDTADICDYEIRADRPLGEMNLDEVRDLTKDRKPRNRNRKRNPLVGILLIVILAALVKSCAA